MKHSPPNHMTRRSGRVTTEHITKICTNCGIEKPLSEFYKNHKMADGRLRQCRACKLAYRADYFEKNRERILAWFRSYKRPESRKDQYRLWCKNNKDRINAAHRRGYYRHHEKMKLKSREYWKAHPAEKLAHTHKRRALQRGSGGVHTKKQVDELYRKQRGCCADCSKKLNKYHKDHIVPLSKGGSNSIYNIQLLCPKCNWSKNDKDPIAHAQSIGRLI